jgi:hypothetical protein
VIGSPGGSVGEAAVTGAGGSPCPSSPLWLDTCVEGEGAVSVVTAPECSWLDTCVEGEAAVSADSLDEANSLSAFSEVSALGDVKLYETRYMCRANLLFLQQFLACREKC